MRASLGATGAAMRGRPPVLRGSFGLGADELVVDNFAGGGGASTGIKAALHRPVDFAINHNPPALAMHKANHPETKHYCEDVFEVEPTEVCGGRPVGLLWASPDCKHHSRAKGKKPLDRKIRGLAWVVIRWAATVRPRVIFLENVIEFEDWGPLDASGMPERALKGETFRAWVAALIYLGYHVEWRTIVAADYGTPTSRTRIFLIARCDGRPIVWPEPTHGPGRAQSWRPAAEIIDWSLSCPSIFERLRPLAVATERRVAAGLRRYVLESDHPFTLEYGGGGILAPFVAPLTHHGGPGTGRGQRGRPVTEPLSTITGAHRGEHALFAAELAPFLVRHGHYSTISGAGLIEGCGAGTFRGQRLVSPLGTVCATNDKHLVCPVIVKHYGGMVGHRVDRILGTVTAKDHHGLAACWLEKMYSSARRGADVRLPLPTVTANGRGGGHLAAMTAFLVKYYGSAEHGQAVDQPLHTVTGLARFGLVMVRGEAYRLLDIGMRMLQPRELFGAQGFPEDYIIAPEFGGKPLTKTMQTSLAGNSVACQVAEVLVEANMRS